MMGVPRLQAPNSRMTRTAGRSLRPQAEARTRRAASPCGAAFPCSSACPLAQLARLWARRLLRTPVALPLAPAPARPCRHSAGLVLPQPLPPTQNCRAPAAAALTALQPGSSCAALCALPAWHWPAPAVLPARPARGRPAPSARHSASFAANLAAKQTRQSTAPRPGRKREGTLVCQGHSLLGQPWLLEVGGCGADLLGRRRPAYPPSTTPGCAPARLQQQQPA